MKPRIISIDIKPIVLGHEILHTLGMLLAHPFLNAQVVVFEALRQDWLGLFIAELTLELAFNKTEAVVIIVDEKLDVICTGIDANLRAEFGNDRNHPEYQRYFKHIRPSDLRRPVLGEQLDVMRNWPPSLATSSSATLRDYGVQLMQLVAEADAAVAAQSEAQRELDDFPLRTRKPFIDRLNAARLALYGQLAEMPHKYPERKLDASSFTLHFFRRGTNNRKPTIADVERDILRLRTRLVKKEGLLEQLLEKQARQQQLREDEEYAKMERELAEAERLQAETEAQIAELQARMNERASVDEEPAPDEPADEPADEPL